MTINEYQKLAMRTCCIPYENKKDMFRHAVFGLCSEAGEISEMVYNAYPWMLIDTEHFKKELGDCCWMIAEACTALDIEFEYLVPTMEEDPLIIRIEALSPIVHDLCSKAGDVAALLQKEYQGHEFSKGQAVLRLRRCYMTIVRICEQTNIKLEDVMQLNIDKLRARFPEGFEVDKSLHRAAGDI